jgi:nitroreductase
MKRYSAQEDGAWVSEFISSRRTTRDFLPTPVPPELIEQILKDSLTAPSGSNTRPFKVAVATGEVRIELAMSFYLAGNHFLRQCAVASGAKLNYLSSAMDCQLVIA